MGCNCGKSTPRPLGTSGNGTSSGSNIPVGTSQTYTLQMTDGQTMTFGTRLEAEAARVRAGGGQII